MIMDSAEKRQAREFASDAIRRRKNDEVELDKIVYLDEDLHTYKYFMTG